MLGTWPSRVFRGPLRAFFQRRCDGRKQFVSGTRGRALWHGGDSNQCVACPRPGLRKLVDGGIRLIKIWLDSSDKEQKRRFEARIDDPLRQWKLSPMDLPSRTKWFEYSRARDMMLEATDTEYAPWHVLRSDDKKRARLNCLRHILDLIPYKKVPRTKIKLPDRSMKGAYDDEASLKGRKFVPEKY